MLKIRQASATIESVSVRQTSRTEASLWAVAGIGVFLAASTTASFLRMRNANRIPVLKNKSPGAGPFKI